MKVPQMSPWLGIEEAAAASETITDNWITEGPRAAAFVDRLKALTGAPYAVLAPNGTLALYLGLIAMGIEPGDEVIVPDITFIASANAVVMAGATPVFVDVNRRNFQIDLDGADRLVTPKTKAIMPVHLFGMAANMTQVMGFASMHNLKVIEDAAQAIGVTYEGKHAGTFGDVGTFSFFADKTITTGEGALVVTRDPVIYERLLLLRNQGRLDRGSFIHPAVGYNFRMTDLQCAVGLAQLDKLDCIITRKQTIARWYKESLRNVSEVQLTEVEPGSNHVPFRMVLMCYQAHQLMAHMQEYDIAPRTFFYPLHKQPCFEYLSNEIGGSADLRDARYPNSIYGYEHGVLLPAFPTMTREQVNYVAMVIKEFYATLWKHRSTNTTTSSIETKITQTSPESFSKRLAG